MTSLRRGQRSILMRRLLLPMLVVCVATPPVFAQTAGDDAPPLLANEVYGLTRNQCGVVMPGSPDNLIDVPAMGGKPARKLRTTEYIAEQVWKGDCANGLATGWGRFGPPGKDGVDNEFWPEQQFAYGRSLDVMRSKNDMTYILHDAGGQTRVVTIRGLGGDGSAAPAWSSDPMNMFGGSAVTADKVNFRTNTTTCYVDTQRFRGCSGDGYPVYGITRQDLGGETKVTENWCPNPRSTAGCEVLWNQIAAETVVYAQSDIASWRERTEAKIKQYADPAGPWLAAQSQREAARRAEAERRVAERAAALRAAEQAYRDSLKTLNAGQLFTLADELAAAGDATKAREVRRALVSRFPDSPLAATAAQQLAGMAPQLPPMAPASPSPPSNAYAGGAGGQPLAECRRVEDASDIPQRMAALPQDNVNLMTRGIIVASDFMIATYSACLPDATAQQIVAQYRKTREETLRTCRQVSTSDNCLESPFQ